jgi:hypothetical protein
MDIPEQKLGQAEQNGDNQKKNRKKPPFFYAGHKKRQSDPFQNGYPCGCFADDILHLKKAFQADAHGIGLPVLPDVPEHNMPDAAKVDKTRSRLPAYPNPEISSEKIE